MGYPEAQYVIDSLKPSMNAVSDKIAVHGTQTFTSNGTFTVPAGVTKIRVIAAGGGGGGGYCNTASSVMERSSAGGGGGSCVDRTFSVTPGQAISITIGAAGAAATAYNKNAGSGGSTVVGDLITCPGGKGAYGSQWNGPCGGDSGGQGGGCGGDGTHQNDAYGVTGGYSMGQNGLYGVGGKAGLVTEYSAKSHASGGGGGSYGNGGNGAAYIMSANSEVTVAAKAGVYGGGGGGGFHGSPAGAAGGKGICIIEW